MTRTLAAAAAAVALLASPAAAAGTPGPFAGAVRQGDTRTHRFDNSLPGQPCPNPMTNYVVSISWTPTTDGLTLSADGVTETGVGGAASVVLTRRNWCTAFDITVTGTSVANVAVYTVSVRRSTTT